MSMLASLARAYDRMEDRVDANGNREVPPFGYSRQNIHACLVLNRDGTLAGRPIAWNRNEKGKPTSRRLDVPYFGGRSGADAPAYFLWDNTAYVLGVSAKKNFDPIKRHESFRVRHFEYLDGEIDDALIALRIFLSSWSPDRYIDIGFTEDLLDRNIVFRLADDFEFIHEREASKNAWKRLYKPDVIGSGICLVSGAEAQIARLHPPIISFDNPARIVSFDIDNDAFSSYGKVQGANAPTSIDAAFAYTAALNKFLEPGSRNRIQIGDASTVFWADASDADAARTAEALFPAIFGTDENVEAQKVGVILEKIRNGQRLEDFASGLAAGVRFHVLGLAPNAARLSIRFWFEDDFGQLAQNYQRFLDDMRIEPPPYKNPNPPLRQYLRETAVQGKSENIPPHLAGEWMRSILTGANYPLTLLSTTLMRIRAGGAVNPLRAAMLKAVINCYAQNSERKITVALDPENTDPAYLLGRLFAVLERFQTLALDKVNATIRDRYFGSASATPRSVFPILIRMNQHHRSKAEKGDKPRLAGYFAKQLSEIMNLLPPDLPATLPLRQQGKFALGYFHQINRRKNADIAPEELNEEDAAA